MGVSKKSNQHPRRLPGAKSPAPHNYKFRCEEANERQAAYDALSIQERLALLDSRLGKGVGAMRQRARLLEKPRAQAKTDEAFRQNIAQEKLKAKDRRAQERHETLPKHPKVER